ncbi:MAG: spermidine synthase [Burkholderiaceae bacterium]
MTRDGEDVGHVPDSVPDSEITLSEEGGVRYLHFGSPWVQGAMRLSRPFALELDYVRQMMAWLLLMSPPGEILQLGLGAGSLTKFCHRYCPDSRVTCVERDPAVVGVARGAFGVPADDERLRIELADAAEYVRRPEARGRHGVIQVDLYDRDAAGPVCDSLAFYRHCRAALAPVGVLVVNLFGQCGVLRPSLTRLSEVFDGRLIVLPSVPAGNTIVLALSGPPLAVPVHAVRDRARVIRRRYRLDASSWLRGWLPLDGTFER